MSMVRIDLRVGGTGDVAWDVRVCRGEAQLAAYTMRALPENGYPAPETDALAAAQIAEALEALRMDTANAGMIHPLGDHLFRALVGPGWPAIEAALGDAQILELALVLEDQPKLAGMPWELMRKQGVYLAAGVEIGDHFVDVAITRRVRRADISYPPLAQPLRYLFAVGAELGDAVRAGAESLGLLRQIGPVVRDRIVQRQSPERLSSEVRDFDPHIVHVICHGRDSATGGVELELWNDDLKQAEYVGAVEIVERLVRARGDRQHGPTIAILSACSTGQRLDAVSSTDFATTLVRRGIPVVFGMSAEIRDVACRLFTRRLGTALVDRTPLLGAAIAGRRAALRSTNLPVDSFDWGLIQIVLGEDIDGALAVAPSAPDSDEVKILRWLRAMSLPIDLDPARRVVPPLCGATEVLDGFARLMTNDSLSALLLLAQPPEQDRRMGKRRAIAEVAAAAVRAGHVPVMVLPSKARGYPTGPARLVQALGVAFRHARSRMALPEAELAVGKLAEPIATEAFLEAIERDALALEADARKAHTLVAAAEGRVVIMLHDVHKYSQGAALALAVLGSTGAGFTQRIPVVMSCAPPDNNDPLHATFDEDLRERLADGITWIQRVELRPLEGATERLAYQRVLLHPFRTTPDYASRAWFLDLKAANRQALEKVLRRLSKGTYRGCPGHFDDTRFLDFMQEAVEEREAVHPADDEDLLRAGGRP
ncbi:MAG TPA: CHAT domain-containing protein [Kofleriaceae bacterium]|nr:CHAT domain-containing protein [Kofleriaceae bacterium]